MQNLTGILKRYWGHESFRPLQHEIIDAVLEGKDVLAILPTGGGKSVCFQLPALIRDGLCLVISPLIALMKDQVENLQAKGIAAAAIHSGLSYPDVKIVLQQAANGNLKFLYVSPERLESQLFFEFLPALHLNCIAVDEAHCISQWGYDFRPPYLRIANIRQDKPKVPLIALTASATSLVQKDICEKLLFGEGYETFRQSFARPNLSYSVFEPEAKEVKMLEIFSKVEGSAIVYCKSRKMCRQVADRLMAHGLSADFYHAGLPTTLRNDKQSRWMEKQTRIMVCTNAFGMGIDKPDVRVVLHYHIPDSLEYYYQEAGRAGRDGKKAYAVLLVEQADLTDMQQRLAIQYPSFENLKTYYTSLYNYLQIAAGSGEGNSYIFTISDFASNFNFNILEATFAIQNFAREGLLTFNESLIKPSTLQVTASRGDLDDFVNNFPSLDYLVKGLLRSYEGILDMPVNIYETAIAKFLRTPIDQIRKDLITLNNKRFVTYSPSGESPHVYLLKNRMYNDAITFDMQRLRTLLEKAADRMEAIESYASTKTVCRSSFISNYFGEKHARPCGICDNCLNAKKDIENLEPIIDELITSIQISPVFFAQLIEEYNPQNQLLYWNALDWLLQEGLVEMDTDGMVKKRGQIEIRPRSKIQYPMKKNR